MPLCCCSIIILCEYVSYFSAPVRQHFFPFMVLCLYNNIVSMHKKWGCVQICVWLYVCGMWGVHTIPIYKPVAGGVFYVYSLYVVTKTDSKRIVRLPLLFFYKNAMGRDRKLFYYNYVVPCGYIYYPHQRYVI